jgi:hypothetical protein
VKHVLSFGAGVQSTTLLLLSCEGLLPRLDHVIFADTQWEPAAVYRHLEWCRDYAAKHGITIDVRSAGNLRDDLLGFWGPTGKSADGKRYASIPAFIRNPDGSRGIVRRQCTSVYKIDVIERYQRDVLGLRPRQRWPLEHALTCWIGISTDEAQRMKRSTRPAVKMWHPLIEAEPIAMRRTGRLFADGWSRQDCLTWLESRGYPRPPKSACIGCPFHSNAEWSALSPAELADAVEVDRLIRESGALWHPDTAERMVGQPYLHSSLVPLSEVRFAAGPDNPVGMADECGGVCGV